MCATREINILFVVQGRRRSYGVLRVSVQQRSPELQQWAFDTLVCSSVYEQQIGNKMGIKKTFIAWNCDDS